MIDEPRRWAYFVAFGPFTVLAFILFMVYAFAADTLDGFGFILLMVFATWPTVLVGMFQDRRQLSNLYGIKQFGFFWDLFALAAPPLAGGVYLWRRRILIRRSAKD